MTTCNVFRNSQTFEGTEDALDTIVKAVENAGGPSAMYKMMNSLDPQSEKPSERM